MIELLFTDKDSLGGAIVKKITWSAWSHVDFILRDGEAVLGADTHGVGMRSLRERMSTAKRAVKMYVPCSDPEAVIKAARTQIGKPYDYFGVLGMGFKRDWQDPKKWFCSELIAWSFSEAAYPLFRTEAIHRITPHNIWTLPNAVEELVV